MDWLGGHKWKATGREVFRIGKPKSPPPDGLLTYLRSAVACSGATSIYWFWMSLDGDRPHLGLAVAPNDDEIVSRIGSAVEPLWRKYSPTNPQFDIVRFGTNPRHDALVLKYGHLLYGVVPT